MTGVKGRSGIKRTVSANIREFINRDERNIPEYLAEIRAHALKSQSVECPQCKHHFDAKGGGRIEALMWLLERHYGKAPQALTVEAKVLTLSGDDYTRMALAMQAEEQAVLEANPIGGTVRTIEGGLAAAPVSDVSVPLITPDKQQEP